MAQVANESETAILVQTVHAATLLETKQSAIDDLGSIGHSASDCVGSHFFLSVLLKAHWQKVSVHAGFKALFDSLWRNRIAFLVTYLDQLGF